MNLLLFLDLIAWAALAYAILLTLSVWALVRDPDDYRSKIAEERYGEYWAIPLLLKNTGKVALLPTLWFISRFFS